MHGGATPRGVASPHFKHGRYSQVIPVRLAAAYDQARTDDDLLALRDEATVLQARIGELLMRVEAGDSRSFWTEAQAALNDMEAAHTARDAVALDAAFDRLRMTFRTARGDEMIWGEVQTTIEALRKVSESERKRLIEMQAMVTVDEVMAFAAALTSVMQQQARDPATLGAIQAGMQRVFEARRGRGA